VLLVLMLFLPTRVAFWAAVGVLISIFGAFWWLPAAGVTLNMLSLFGFVLAMGVLVDDAIIVSERVQELQAQGVSGLRGAIQGVREVAMPVTLGVTIGLVAFLPGLFVPPSWATQFMKPVAIVMILTLAFSLLESLLILPAHLVHEPVRTGAPSFLERVRSRLNTALAAFIARVYRPFLRRALGWRYATVAAFAAALMIGVAVIQGEYLTISLEEDGSYGQFHVHLVPPIGTPYAESEARVKQFVDALAKVEAELNPSPTAAMPRVVEGVEVVLEESDPQVYVEFTSEARQRFRLQDVVKTWYKHIGDVGDFSPDFHTPTEKDLVDVEVELRAQDPAVLTPRPTPSRRASRAILALSASPIRASPANRSSGSSSNPRASAWDCASRTSPSRCGTPTRERRPSASCAAARRSRSRCAIRAPNASPSMTS